MNHQKLANISIIFIGVVLFFAILKEFSSFLRPFFIALILTFLFIPITRIKKEKKHLIYLYILITIIIVSLFFIFIGNLNQNENINNINQSSNKFNLSNLITTPITFNGHNYDLTKYIDTNKINSYISNIVKVVFSGITDFFKELFLILLFLMFMIPTFDTLKLKIEKRLFSNEKLKFRKSLEEIEKSIREYLVIKSLISLGTAFFSAIIMLIFSVNYLLIFTFLIFILNFIPNIGSLIAVGLILIFYFIQNGFSISFILLTIFLIIIQIIFGNYIEPKFTGKKLNLSPIVILLSLFFWGYIWGIVGMLFAVPFISIIKIILSHINSTKNFVEFLG